MSFILELSAKCADPYQNAHLFDHPRHHKKLKKTWTNKTKLKFHADIVQSCVIDSHFFKDKYTGTGGGGGGEGGGGCTAENIWL